MPTPEGIESAYLKVVLTGKYSVNSCFGAEAGARDKMHDKHQWMSHTLLDMIVFCDMNGMGWQREILLDAVTALGWYRPDLVADSYARAALPSDGGCNDLDQIDNWHPA